MSDWSPKLLDTLPGPVPLDDDGFVISFEVADPALHDFFDKFGFVCIRNILDDQERQATLDEFFGQFDRNDPQSIEEFYDKQQFKTMGLIGLVSDIDSVTQVTNRQNPKLYRAYATLLREKELIVGHGRLGALRPTIDENGAVRKDWKTLSGWLHLDCNPVTGRVAVASVANAHLQHDFSQQWLPQGFLTLTDARKEDGGFHCVPGGHKLALAWARHHHPSSRGSSLQVDNDDPLRQHIQPIPIRKGCLFTVRRGSVRRQFVAKRAQWSAFLFHGNRPNASRSWRIVQYCRMYPLRTTPFKALWPKKEFPAAVRVTSLGKRLFGFRSWSDDFDPYADTDGSDSASESEADEPDDDKQDQWWLWNLCAVQ